MIYKKVYSLQNGRLIQNKENKVEYTDKNGVVRVKTNPKYKDFQMVGKLPKKPSISGTSDTPTQYIAENGFFVPVYSSDREAKENKE